ncbi:universal stress protein [Natronococcus wangiae]|uniref:universal stress protein n=1 Tax=Natronococcus wangiae TaxID=3068275 RepID=UPI003133CB39
MLTSQTGSTRQCRESEAEEILTDVKKVAEQQDANLDAETIVGSSARAIVQYAEEHDIDHIVLGSHGRTGTSRVLLGSVAETVARRAPVPVTIVR